MLRLSNTFAKQQSADRNTHQQLNNFDRFVARFEELLAFAQGVHKTVDYYLFPLVKDWKNPETGGRSWTNARDSVQLTLDAARKRIARQLGNIALVGTCNPEFDKDTLGIGVIDVDLDENGQFKMPEERVNQLIDELNSFTVRTRSGGYHIYLAVTSGVTKHLFEQYGTYSPYPRYAGKIWGEFRLFNQYVVAVGSYAPPYVEGDKKRPRPDANGFYEVYRDAPIRVVNLKTIPNWIEFGSPSGPNKNGGRTRPKKITVDHEETARLVDAGSDRNYSAFTNAMGYSLNDIVQNDEILRCLLGSAENHHTYNSRSEADFYVASKLNRHGFSCEQVWAILQTFRPYEKTLDDRYLETTLSKFDWEHPSADTIADTFPTTLPDKRCIIISSLPRTGKSYYGISQMGQYESGIYVSQNHSIITKQFGLFNRLYPNKTSVQLYGKQLVCNHEVNGQKGHCKDCPLKLRANRSEYSPDESGSMAELLAAASGLVEQHTHVKPENIPDEYCKYEMLHCCEHFVDFVFTVPQFLTSQEDLTKVAKRDIAVFDEDTTFAHFYPHSYSWGMFHSKPNGSFYNTCSLTAQQVGSLTAVRDSVVHARDSKKSPERETLYNAIIGLINGIEEVYTILTENSSESMNARKDSSKVANLPITELKDRIEQVRFIVDGSETKLSELSDEEKGSILHNLSRRKDGTDTPMDLSHICEPYLYPVELEQEGLYLENLTPGEPRYSVQGSNPRSLYAIADETRLIHPVDCAKKYVLIGFSQAGKFAQHVEPNEEERIELEKVRFKYLANYVVLGLEGRDENNQKTAHIADKRMKAAIRTFMAQNKHERKQVGVSKPAFILTSSKSNQQRIREQYHNQMFDARKEDIDDIILEWETGKSIILYQNSVISRGIDIPFGDAIFVDKCHFAQPYLNYLLECNDRLLINRAISEEQSKSNNAAIWDRKNKSTADETTNSVLRISPVKGCGEEQVKVIIMREMDMDYLHLDLSLGMKTIRVPTNMDLDMVIRTVRDAITRVYPDIVSKKGGGQEITKRTAITPEEVTAAQKREAIEYGKSFTEADESFTMLRNVCEESRYASNSESGTENDSTIKTKRSDKTERKIGQIQRKMLGHPSFRNLKAGGTTTNTIRSTLLNQWTRNGSKRVRYSTSMCERALSDLITKQVLKSEVIQTRHEGGSVMRDIVKERYKLWMDSQSYINMLALFPDLKLKSPFLGEVAVQKADIIVES